MKTAKRLCSVLVVTLMVLVMSIPAFAAETGSITVTNATTGKIYAAYKVFDLTYNGDNVTYTYTKTGASDFLYDALTASGSPFTLKATTNADVYNVSTSASANDIAAWLNTHVALLGSASASTTALRDTVSFTGLDLGYYYVTSALGSTVTLTSTKPSASIVDKNQHPGPDTTNGYKSIVDGSGNNVNSMSAEYGDTVTFKLTATATNYDGATKITKYVAHDLPETGYSNLTLVSVEVGGTPLAGTAYNTLTLDTGEFQVNIPWTDDSGNFLYTRDGTTTASIVVTLTATVTDDSDTRTNKGWFTWDGKAGDGGSENVTVNSYSITIDKYDSSTSAKLANAQFVLKNSSNKFYNLTSGAVSWVDAQAGATVFTTNSDGAATIEGLENGTYTVMEIKAPDGYVLPTTGTSVTINDADGTASISNTKGNTTPLPETGGIGTVIFVTVGLALVVVTGIFLVTNKRMSKESI